VSKMRDALHEYLTYAAASYELPWRLETEYQFHPDRKWRFDFCWVWDDDESSPSYIAVEFDGFMAGGGKSGHSSVSGIMRDVEKLTAAQLLGWRVFRANTPNVRDGSFYTLMGQVLQEEADNWQDLLTRS
jgi:hypothetical protein